MSVILESYKINNINIINSELPSNTTLNISFLLDRHMDQISSSHFALTIRGNLGLQNDNTDNPFNITMEMTGIFSLDDSNADQAVVEKDATYALLPFFRSHISTAMASIDMRPLIIPIDLIQNVF